MANEISALVLVGEDDPSLREVVVEVLESEGFQVCSAQNAQEVVNELKREPDLVMLDFHGVTTSEVVRAVRSTPGRPPLLVVSGDRRVDEVMGEYGADAYLPKPFDIPELVTTVSGLLRDWAAR